MDTIEHIEKLLNLRQQLTAVEIAEKKEHLIMCLNYLLMHDFSKLIQILYKVDVDEQNLKNLLQQNPQTDAAIIIAELLLQRQEEKIKTKETVRPNEDIQEEDKW